MSLWRRSLAEDNVDRYNHTLSVLFLLLLSLVTWLLPLVPSLQPTVQPNNLVVPRGSAAYEHGGTRPKLRTKAACWCPQQFTSSMVNYANSVCSTKFRNALLSKDSTPAAGLYHSPTDIIPIDRRDLYFRPNVTFPKTVSKPPQVIVKRQQPEAGGTPEGDLKFMRVDTPCTLFLLAVGLALPHLVCLLLSSLFGSFNVHQTLQASVSGAEFDPNNRRQLNRDLAQSVARATASNSSTVGIIYLLLKALAFIAAVAGLIVVHTDLLPRARSLKDEGNNDSASAFELKMSDDVEAVNETVESEGNIESFNGMMLLCDLEIRVLQNVAQYTLQCVFNVDLETEAFSMSPVPEPFQLHQESMLSSASVPIVSEIYVTLYLIVQTHLLVLTIVNIFSLITWVFKLFIGSCKSKVMFGKGRLPLDAVFLLQMAMENTSPAVVQDLSQALPATDKNDEDEQGIPLSE